MRNLPLQAIGYLPYQLASPYRGESFADATNERYLQFPHEHSTGNTWSGRRKGIGIMAMQPVPADSRLLLP